MATEYIQVGKLVATHGIKGDLIVEHALGEQLKSGALSRVKAVFIEPVKGSYIPYFVEKITVKNQGEWLLKLEGTQTKEAAKLLTRKNLWLERSVFDSLIEGFQPVSLIGYTVMDNGRLLSEVEEVIEQPHQILLKITYQEKEVLIPLHSETLKSVDPKGRKVHVELPDGLLEIYLEA
ncbi:16S rRNA processing protein RimM [Arachidicoccus rhizosphaerae]|uniref:Ribosome maturation factor RimM n=1 Tax=Arachidicoccus rhizosphaerae TaxID=551991 RepID=A0A1H4CDH4_9BACT|nr:ribosome maturation factor RimM [Arachidicoccus rhizosphaerae]SEA58132.1 16S rRNA processing protein RimM [Arachidicoccus rhizosphaerae]